MRTGSTARSLLAASALLLASGRVQADVIDVPGDAPTIHFAIGLAQPGDTVLVQPGTWTTPLPYGGKQIEVRSAMGPELTIVDVTGLATDAAIISGGPGAILDGFTIRGAVGHGISIGSESTAIVRNCIVEGTDGIGIFVDTDAAPSISACVVAGSTGPGIFALGFGTSATATACVIRDNAGGGVSGGVTLIDSLVEGNGNPSLSFGGGIIGGVTAIDCVISGNTAVRGGGAAMDVTMQGCVVVGNVATWGGGYYNDNPFGGAVSGAAFLDNTASSAGGGAYMTAFLDSIFGPINRVEGCVFAGNEAPAADGLFLRAENIVGGGLNDVESCSFDGDAIVVGQGNLDVDLVILRGTASPITSSAAVDVDWSDVEGGWAGTGNIDADPQWIDASADVYCLAAGSPCIDAGDPLGPTDPDGSPLDMGAHAFAVICDAGEPLQGTHVFPRLDATGTLLPGTTVEITLTGALESALATLVIGFSALEAPLKGGTLVPDPFFLLPGLPVGVDGTLVLSGTWPGGVPTGFTGWIQYWLPDPQGPQGFAASNALVLVAP